MEINELEKEWRIRKAGENMGKGDQPLLQKINEAINENIDSYQD